ncbi:Secreted protein [Vibrio crassostreae]|jgi:hypothetical protein|uniref:Secreted protein n=1 Tax=Vibrio crassostreae TaxID=246167 RepID=A0A4R2GFG4_9VIBR|nr:hypothetical protein [Vibrio crassostreae]MDH5951139.1 hypothetical protein [Vibrio crassostreae]ROO55610.1 hypothetical protein EDB56_102269 [Vibrio crassostreae]ROO71669.1 hypothetical protein EDB57_2261 [Vibrio crassostreae]ROO72549.1 hypothetical protein EDB64_1980 [Vibrio crassostreae]ROO73440.1 hypothetical protein EDB53_2154 [Vibrio crassostreae]
MKLLSTLVLGLSLGFSTSAAMAQDHVKIIDFLVDNVWVCDKNNECADVSTKTLPDPTQSGLIVENYDRKEQMVMVKIDGQEKWFDQIEVQLNKTAVASVVCSTQVISAKSDSGTYATLGLGEGCN